MRDAFMRQGMSAKAAKGKAARIYNSRHPGHANPWAHEKRRKSKTYYRY